ncbi:MAG: ATP-binding protein [Prolixibacteraceae bacterium]|nr:ATP-binding protein [Prolixibacteraceae bacterium]
MYQRDIIKIINKWLASPEIIILIGARQVGKSTLIEMLAKSGNKINILNCENPIVADILKSKNINDILSLFGEQNDIVALDEAQDIPEIGKILKLLYDDKRVKHKIIATGSSSFELSNKTGEPLTGRNLKFKLYPLSISEISYNLQWLEMLESLSSLLIYGTYPGIIDLPADKKKKKLLTLSGDYLFKDIYKFEQVRNPEVLRKLLKALALQIGNLVSINELASLCSTSTITVERYLDLLEKSFVIFKLGSFSKNLRNELKKSRKYYFFDLGIRNALLNNFIPLEERTDIGGMWENFCIAEYMKTIEYAERNANLYFWRTYDGAEIDLIEEYEGKLYAFEFKWNEKKKATLPKSFSEKYDVETFVTINRRNFNMLMK